MKCKDGARTAVDGGGSVATGDIGINDYVNYALEDNGALRNPVSNLQHTEQQHIDLSAVVKSDEEWPLTNTQQPLNTDKMISGGINATCGGVDGNGDTITCYPENVTCVGDPEYCNLTELEYLQMLYDYIFPTPGEWVLIGFHAAVFIVGLVSYLHFLVCGDCCCCFFRSWSIFDRMNFCLINPNFLRTVMFLFPQTFVYFSVSESHFGSSVRFSNCYSFMIKPFHITIHITQCVLDTHTHTRTLKYKYTRIIRIMWLNMTFDKFIHIINP